MTDYVPMRLSSCLTKWAIALCLHSAVVLADEPELPPAQRPNLVIILADDLGFTDIGAFGSEIDTPNLDALAASGLRMTRFHAASTCAPTRAMLFSGNDNHLAGLGSQEGLVTENQQGQPGYEMYMTDRVESFVIPLRDSGYQTFMSGKWHLGRTPETSPGARGFERWFALLEGGGGHFDSSGISPRDPVVTYIEQGQPAELPEDFYSSDYFTQKLISYLSDHRDPAKPFFAYLAFTAPHWPLQARAEDMALYQGKYDAGYEVLRQQRIARAKELGIFPDTAATADTVGHLKPWNELSEDERAIETRKMEVYAAMIHRMDWNVGKLLEYLDASGERDNTIILFLSDNGAEGHLMEAYPSFVPWLAANYDNRLENIGHRGSFTSLGAGWAHASGGPLRLYKGYLSEGGARVPAIIQYPAALSQGATSHTYATVMDIAPTMLELAGLEPAASDSSASHSGNDEKPGMLGKSMQALISGQSDRVHAADESVAWELFGRRAVFRDNWKLLWMDPPHGPGAWQLYDMENDPGETNDLAGLHPQLRDSMASDWSRYAESFDVILPNKPIAY